MQMSLLNADRSEISSGSWLQFDSSKQEFYGIPLAEDVGLRKYQLVCKDRHGALDTL